MKRLYKSLGEERPDLIEFWDYEKNICSPFDVSLMSAKKYWWKCVHCGKSNYVSNSKRADGQNGCSDCRYIYSSIKHHITSTKNSENNLICFLENEKLKYWDYEKNGALENYTFYSSMNVFWKCPDCGNSWNKPIYKMLGGKVEIPCLTCRRNAWLKERVSDMLSFAESIDCELINPYDYKTAETKLRAFCLNCNSDFITSYIGLRAGYRCPCNKISKGERVITSFLERFSIDFKFQYRINNCRDKNPLPFDFFIESMNVLIEYDGEFHYIPFIKIHKEKAEEKLLICKNHDLIKTKYCLDNGIKLIRIPYWEFDNIESILTQELCLN